MTPTPGESAAVGSSDPPEAYATFGSRAGAWLIDAVPHAVVPAVVADLADSTVAGLAAFVVTGILWSILPEARAGWTPGKRIVGIRLVDMRGRGRIGWLRAAVRWLVKYGVGGVLPVSYLWYFRGRSRRTWHDYAAGTIVVSDRRG